MGTFSKVQILQGSDGPVKGIKMYKNVDSYVYE